MSLIQILDAHCANQIAAGEVVERPISVVKELVENALDAKATVIDILIEGSGVSLIQIRDNGSGIAPDDLPLALLRHATSKIRTIDDLNQLVTLGFRGEALPSIASVSKLEICSRTSDQTSGFQVKVLGGNLVEQVEIGCPAGTTVRVEDLFYNTPARRKFLKSDNTEFGLISDMVGRIAIARPDVSFSLRRGNRTILRTPGNNNRLEAISCVFGNTVARCLIPISYENERIRITGFLSPPSLNRASRHSQVFIINGRVIRSNLLSSSLEQGYHTLIPAKSHPIAILCLETDPAHYDVNVHPTKMEIRFKDEQTIAHLLSESVKECLLQSSPLKPFSLDCHQGDSFQRNNFERNIPQPDNLDKVHLDSGSSSGSYSYAQNKESPINDYSSPRFAEPRTNTSNYLAFIKQTLDEIPLPSLNEEPTSDCLTDGTIEGTIDGSNGEQLNLELDGNTGDMDRSDFLLSLTPIGQVFNSYILATYAETLVIIDQHAAHERINYEQKFAEFKASPKASQQLLVPVTLDFSPIEEQIVLDHIWELTELGFVLEHFGDRTYLLRGVPLLAKSAEAEKLLREYLAIVQAKNSSPPLEELIEDWIYLLACRESLKANQKLTTLEMSQLLVQLSRTENPFTCPHGRPVLTYLNRSDFEKQFLRK